ncbi:hypothetical protein E4U41_004267, partial [Claviceps citrina]
MGSVAGTAAAEQAGRQTQPRILFLDAYDSFTNNIVSLLKDALGSQVLVHVLHMDLKTADSDPTPDWTEEQFLDRLADFDAVVCGPGPGSPLWDADVGAFKLLWELPPERSVPVLGICLGFQSLVEHFGGRVRRLRGGGLHGMVRDIDHVRGAPGRPADIFDGVARFRATLYHSLCADVGQDAISDGAWPEERWAAPRQAPELVPLAWLVEHHHHDDGVGERGGDAGGPERILMAVRHASRPLWGVQYHPESVCTEDGAQAVVRNWFHQAVKWNDSAGRAVRRNPSVSHVDSLDPHSQGLAAGRQPARSLWWDDLQSGLARRGISPGYSCRRIELPAGVDTADVAEVLGLGATGADTIILDSSSTVTGDALAKHSIIALDVQDAPRFEYHVGDDHMLLRRPATARRPEEECQRIRLGQPSSAVDPRSPWHVLSEYWRCRRVPGEDDDGAVTAPVFKAGFVGFVTYEMGLSTLSPGLVAGPRGHHRPDLCMAWVSKSIVLDHEAGVAYIQSLTTGDLDDSWMDGLVRTMEGSRAWRRHAPGCGPQHHDAAPPRRSHEALLDSLVCRRRARQQGEATERLRVCVPDAGAYEADVRKCQEYIREGESYELCLTAQTTMTRPRGHVQQQPQEQCSQSSPCEPEGAASSSSSSSSSRPGTPWQIYRALRARQPAPFGSFIRLGGATVISCSPERFVQHDANGLCSMRPMKGTVRKSAACSTLSQAEKMLHTPKEEAENLMIVDLVRHDLYGVCGAQSVTVSDFLRVEEYATVFQMVTAVEAQLPRHGLAAGTDPATDPSSRGGGA